MKIKKRGRTTEFKFDNRKESIAFLRAFGLNKSADALQEAEDREQAKRQEKPAQENVSS